VNIQVAHLDATTLNEVVASNRTILVDFCTTWCEPCQRLAALLDRIVEERGNQLSLGRIDVGRDRSVAARLGITVVPTLILFRGGQPVDRLVGFGGARSVRSWLSRHIGPRSEMRPRS